MNGQFDEEEMRRRLWEQIAQKNGLSPMAPTEEVEPTPAPVAQAAPPMPQPQPPQADEGLAADRSANRMMLGAGIGRAGEILARAGLKNRRPDTAYFDQMAQTAEGRRQLVHKSLADKLARQGDQSFDREKMTFQAQANKDLHKQDKDAAMEQAKYLSAEEWRRLQAQLGNTKDLAALKAAADKAAETPKTAEGLRKELMGNPVTKEAQVVAAAYDKIQSSFKASSPAGDIAGIFAFMKLLDPTSSVRETEYANATNAGGVPEHIRNAWNKAKNGQFLQPEQRADFLARSGELIGAQMNRYNALAGQYRAYAQRAGVPAEDAVFDLGFDSEKPEAGGGTMTGAQAQPPVLRGKDGRVYRLQSDGTYE